ncbi:MAG: DUF1194 domain-containing protein [Pseudomonadota bacterium]
MRERYRGERVRSCAAQCAKIGRAVNATYTRMLLCFVLIGIGVLVGAPLQAQTPVALELVLAVDTSTSVDGEEFALQQQGFADAFRHRDVIGAIERAGQGGVAVTLVHWSGEGQQTTSVGWTIVKDAQSARALAARIEQSGRQLKGFTDIAGALRFALAALQGNAIQGRRQVIDVSGDGTSNGPSAASARDVAVAAGVTVNGLVIHNEDIDLGELAKINLFDHYKTHVVGGPGAFLMAAKDFQDFRIAIRKKLVREIIGPILSKDRSGFRNRIAGRGDGQRADAFPGGGENRIGERRRCGGCSGLAHTARQVGAGHEVDLHRRR